MHGIGMYGHGVGVDRRRVVEGGKAISPTVQFLERREGEGGTRTCMSLLLCLPLLLVIFREKGRGRRDKDMQEQCKFFDL